MLLQPESIIVIGALQCLKIELSQLSNSPAQSSLTKQLYCATLRSEKTSLFPFVRQYLFGVLAYKSDKNNEGEIRKNRLILLIKFNHTRTDSEINLPWQTPDITFTIRDFSPSISTCCFLPDKKSSNQGYILRMP